METKSTFKLLNQQILFFNINDLIFYKYKCKCISLRMKGFQKKSLTHRQTDRLTDKVIHREAPLLKKTNLFFILEHHIPCTMYNYI